MSRIEETHQIKLHSLVVANDLAPCNPYNVIFNFSSETLSPWVKTIKVFGLDFWLQISKLDFYKYFVHVEKIFHDISREVTMEILRELKYK